MPVPPPRRAFRLAISDIHRGGGTVVRHMAQHGVDFRLPSVSLPLRPPFAHARLVAFELEPPHGIEGHRDHRSVVGPMLERGPAARDQSLKGRRTVAPAPAPQDEVMGPRKGVDAVNLHESQPVEHAVQIGARAGPRFRSQQQVTVQKQTPGSLIWDDGAVHLGDIPLMKTADSRNGPVSAHGSRQISGPAPPVMSLTNVDMATPGFW